MSAASPTVWPFELLPCTIDDLRIVRNYARTLQTIRDRRNQLIVDINYLKEQITIQTLICETFKNTDKKHHKKAVVVLANMKKLLRQKTMKLRSVNTKLQKTKKVQTRRSELIREQKGIFPLRNITNRNESTRN